MALKTERRESTFSTIAVDTETGEILGELADESPEPVKRDWWIHFYAMPQRRAAMSSDNSLEQPSPLKYVGGTTTGGTPQTTDTRIAALEAELVILRAENEKLRALIPTLEFSAPSKEQP